MTRHLACVILTVGLIGLATSTAADASSFASADNGIGLAVGEPAGITYFRKIDDQSFAQAFIGSNLVIGLDYAIAFPGAVKNLPNFTPYVGGGLFLFSSRYWDHARDNSGIGLRMPLGVLIQIPNAPLHFHLEVAPSTTINPFMYSFVDAMIGARFLF